MSVKVINACKSVDVPPTAKLVLFMLAEHAHDDGSNAFPSVGLIAWETGLSERAVRNSLRTLEGAGVIEVAAKSTRRRPTTYRVVPWRGVQRPPYDADEAPTSGGHTVPAGGHHVPPGGHVVPLEGHHMPPNRQGTVTEPPEEKTLPTTSVGTPIVEIVSETSETHLHPADTRNGALPARTRPRDEVFEAVAAVCYGDDWTTQLTETARGPLNRAVKELRAVGATPLDVAERSRAYVGWLGQKPIPMALVKHWPRLADPIQQLPRHELEALNEEQAMEVRMAEAERRERQRLAEEAAMAAEAAEVVPIRQLGPDPAVSPSVRHPRRPGESVREYVARIGRISVGAERPGDRDEEAG